MNQQTYNNRPQQQRQIHSNTGQCRKCGTTMNERQLTQHERGCKPPRVQQQSNQNRRQPQQQQNQQRQQQNNTSDRQQQNPFKNFQKNFEWANNPFFSQHNQQTQSDDQSDDSNQEEEEEYGNETQQPGFQYSCQVNGNQMPNNVSFQFSTIFGPNGVFTQSMNQMNNVMQSVNININQNGNQQNRRNQQNVYTFNTPNGMQCNQYSYNTNFNQQYENDDQNDEGDDQYEQEESEEEEEQQEQEQFEEEQLGLGEDEISQMPTIQFRVGRGGSTDGSSKNCVICMNDFKYGDRLRTLRCIHRFHANCVDDWLRLKRECPICRFDQTQ